MKEETKYTLQDFTDKEEAKACLEEIDTVLAKYSAQFAVFPIINNNGTLGAKVEVFKKVELVPKSIPSPFIPNGDNTQEETDTKLENS